MGPLKICERWSCQVLLVEDNNLRPKFVESLVPPGEARLEEDVTPGEALLYIARKGASGTS